jgi:ABC-type uncharacterized transport system substrate-binding protein
MPAARASIEVVVMAERNSRHYCKTLQFFNDQRNCDARAETESVTIWKFVPNLNSDAERARKYAAELVALGPDVILASGDHSVVASQQATRTVPIVFTLVSDPVGTGYVESLARPGGNMTGFTLFENSTSAKYMEVLKEIAPGVKRAAVVGEAGTATGTGQFAAIQAAAPALGVELSAIVPHKPTEAATQR